NGKANSPPLSPPQLLKITQFLRLHQQTKSKRFARDLDIATRRGRDLNEHATIWTALVQLARGVQKAWTVTGGSRHLKAVADSGADLLQVSVVLGGLFYIGEHGNVIARFDSLQLRR